jgi:glycosyltransferase involved in cell wall biosynthesis
MAEAPRVTVVIPTFQRRDALQRALRLLAAQTLPAAEYEVVVSVDGSTDGTHELLAGLAAPFALRVAEGPRRGRASACNAGLALARGEIVVILDDDMQATPQLLERHARHHPAGSQLCVMGAAPVRLDAGSPLAARYVRAKFDEHLLRLAQPGHVFAPRDFYSGNASLRAQTVRAIGGFDETYTAYGNEDVDLWIRLRAAGVEFRFDPQAVAHQEYAKDLRALARDTLAKGGTAVALARAHPDVFQQLRLASPRDGSRPWLAARAVALALTRRVPSVAPLAFSAGALLERMGLWRRPLFYRALLDYAFWAGVDAELDPERDRGELAQLARRLTSS